MKRANHNETGHEVSVDWRGASVRAWLPSPLSSRHVKLDESEIRATEQAVAAALAFSSRIPLALEPIGRLLLRAEGVASSRVEDIRAPIQQVLLAQAGSGTGVATEVAGNLAVVERALGHSLGTRQLQIQDIHNWHSHLMTDYDLPDHLIGSWRSEIGWIGGSSPRSAVFVPAPPDAIDDLMSDLVDVANECPWDPVTTAAMVHAQFETIHPYGDGNGRVGRLLTLWVLVRHTNGLQAPPPISVLIARDTDSYISVLGAFRLGRENQLVEWFSGTLHDAGNASLEWVKEIEDLVASWSERTRRLRSDSTGRRIVGLLAGQPVLSVDMVAKELDVSLVAARNGLNSLVDVGVLEDIGLIPSGPGRPRRWWSAADLLDLISRW